MAPEVTTLVDLLERASGVPETGLRFLDRRERATFLTWGELHGVSQQVAAHLRALGVEPGDRVALIFSTGPEFFHAFFGILLAGAVPVPLYPPVRLGRLDEYHRRTAAMLAAASARLVLAEGRVRRLLGKTVEQARALGHLPLGCIDLSRLASTGRIAEAAPPPTAADLALVQFSSGTTVDPKPVALSHRAVLAQVLALNSHWPDEANLRHTGVSWLPLYHDMGLIGCVFPALERPSVLTLIGPEHFVRRPALWLRAISEHRASVSVAPNFAYGLCVEKIRDEEMEGVDLSSWRVALNGAEPVSGDVLRAFQHRFARWGFRPEALTPVYGLSEATLAVTFSRLDRPFLAQRFDREALARGWAVVCEKGADGEGREMISVGRPLPGTRVRIVDPGASARESLEGKVGRVQVSGPSVMEGYLDRPEATARALKDGWLDTGDLGFLHRGELYLTGRAKDVVILRGRNYSPSDLEQAVEGLPGLRTGCVVAVSRAVEGKTATSVSTASSTEKLWLFVEVRQDATAEERAALPERCAEALLTHCSLSPDSVVVLDPGTLPRTSSGKLRRSTTLDRHLAGELKPPAPVNAWRMAGAVLGSSLAHARAREPGDEG